MYGIDIEHVGELMRMVPPEPGQSRTLLTARAEYSLEKLVLHTADEHEISTSGGEAATLFTLEGALEARGAAAGLHKLMNTAPGCGPRLRGLAPTTGYIVRGPAGTEIKTGTPA